MFVQDSSLRVKLGAYHLMGTGRVTGFVIFSRKPLDVFVNIGNIFGYFINDPIFHVNKQFHYWFVEGSFRIQKCFFVDTLLFVLATVLDYFFPQNWAIFFNLLVTLGSAPQLLIILT